MTKPDHPQHAPDARGIRRVVGRVGRAAVVRSGEPGAEKTARLVPDGADIVRLGKMILGYRHEAGPKIAWQTFFRATRLLEIEMIIASRWGGVVALTDDHNHQLAEIAASLLDRNQALIWISNRIRRLPREVVEEIVEAASRRRRNYKADRVAKMLDVVDEERRALGLKTIGAIDRPKASRTRDRREKRRAANEAKRREAGAKPRAEYVAESVSAEARRLGVSRMTIYRRRREMAELQCYRSEAPIIPVRDSGPGPVTFRPSRSRCDDATNAAGTGLPKDRPGEQLGGSHAEGGRQNGLACEEVGGRHKGDAASIPIRSKGMVRRGSRPIASPEEQRDSRSTVPLGPTSQDGGCTPARARGEDAEGRP